MDCWYFCWYVLDEGAIKPFSIRWIEFYLVFLLLTGSPNSFSKYGRGDAAPSHPTLVLMTLLDRRPELLAEIEALALAPAT